MTGFTEILTQNILVTSILMGLITLVGLVGNALMLRALIVYRKLRTDFYTVFGCLSIVDSLFLIISAPAHIMEMVMATDITTDAWCKGSHYLIDACSFISACLMVVLTVLRGILLTNRNSRQHKASYLLIVCAVISVTMLLCSVPIMFVFTSYRGMCDFVDPLNQLSPHAWLVSSFSAFVPLFLIILIYLLTYLLGKRYFPDSYSPIEKEKSWLVTYIIIAFTIFQIPYRVFVIFDLNTDPTDFSQLNEMYTVRNYLMCLVMADKAVRPILYTKLASDLSEAFDEVINCTLCAKHYSMGSRFNRTCAVYTSPGNSAAVTTVLSSTESNLMQNTDRAASSSSEASATSQTPLTRRNDDLDMAIDILEG
ncbi:unnamed protein product [Candidula unifasciata]|uniref:G-protein coupled receptors family 1 profile domain-containing protein n=1 Tax=Candidula unifasciata TaxID=100452 RepID=A0A8S3YFU9_9EUPU|nr:unnamed protein product [Candidula unifasciata]